VDAQSRPIGYFGASTGAAAALVAAAELGKGISAVVSRGGRPDLATRFLESVTAPTLLIVGSLDIDVVAMNQAALRELGGEKKMALVPGASHLFEEPGTLERVISLAADWFVGHGLGSSGLQHL
jgi:pimeloyl-ACP methyl ester carboxylesterase